VVVDVLFGAFVVVAGVDVVAVVLASAFVDIWVFVEWPVVVVTGAVVVVVGRIMIVVCFCFILSTGTRIRIDSVMRPGSSRGRNTSDSVTVTVVGVRMRITAGIGGGRPTVVHVLLSLTFANIVFRVLSTNIRTIKDIGTNLNDGIHKTVELVGSEAICRSMPVLIHLEMPTMIILIPFAFVASASATVWCRSRFGLHKVIIMRILLTPIRAP